MGQLERPALLNLALPMPLHSRRAQPHAPWAYSTLRLELRRSCAAAESGAAGLGLRREPGDELGDQQSNGDLGLLTSMFCFPPTSCHPRPRLSSCYAVRKAEQKTGPLHPAALPGLWRGTPLSGRSEPLALRVQLPFGMRHVTCELLKEQ